MKKKYTVVVVIPVGPNTNVEFIRDTIESYLFYTRAASRIIIVDDSRQDLGERTREFYPDIDVVCTPAPAGAMAGLYLTLCQAFKHAITQYDFDLLLKLDTDALVVGADLHLMAIDLFRKDPQMAIAGQYPLDYNGQLWDMGWPRARIINATMTWKAIRRPIANVLLRKLYLRALRNNYRTGESVFGGSYFLGKSFLDRLNELGQLPHKTLGKLNLGEDHIFGILARAAGMNLGSLSGPGQPFGCAWKGLPVSPAQLLLDGRKIIHSTRSWQQMDEHAIREFFKEQRVKEAGEK